VSRSVIYEQIPIICAKIAKIGSPDPEIICLRAIIKKDKKKEINANKIYSPVGKFAERAKQYNECLSQHSQHLFNYVFCLC